MDPGRRAELGQCGGGGGYLPTRRCGCVQRCVSEPFVHEELNTVGNFKSSASVLHEPRFSVHII